jgi:large subunit ribosomal protein L16
MVAQLVKKKKKGVSAPLFLQKKKQSKTFFRGSSYDNIFFSKRPPLSLSKRFGHRCVVLYATDYGRLSKEEIEAARRLIRKRVGKKVKLSVKAYAYIPVTRKPKEVRMGKGKGRISEYICYVKPGKPLFELRRASLKSSLLALEGARSKLSVRSKVCSVQLPI